MTNETIEDVRSFWDANPLLAGEIDAPVGTETWFRLFDDIKTNQVFGGYPREWVAPVLAGGKSVLDVGTGPGYWNRLFGHIKNVEYHGIDITERAVQLCGISQEIFHSPGIIRVGNAEKMDFPDESFDYIVSEGVVHHTPDTQACIDEIYRVLRKNGHAYVSVYYKNIVLRSRVLFKLCLVLMKIFNIALKGRGREQMSSAPSPEDLVRMYDGKMNPIGKAYTRRDLRIIFSRFSAVRFQRYYFPTRAAGLRFPNGIQRFLGRTLGLMILVKAQK